MTYRPEERLPTRLERIRRELGARSLSAAVMELVRLHERAYAARLSQPDPEPSPPAKSRESGS